MSWHLRRSTVERMDRIADRLGMTRLALAETLLLRGIEAMEKDAE